MPPVSNVKEPTCEFMLIFTTSLEDVDATPPHVARAVINTLKHRQCLPKSLSDNRKNLQEVATENNGNASKRAGIIEKIVQCALHSLDGMMMLHASLVLNYECCPSKEISTLAVFRDVTVRFCVESVDGNFEHRVRSAPAWQQ
jgi:hypothetical protein